MIWVLSLSTTDLVTRSLTAMLYLTGIRSLIGFSNRVWPLVLPVLYLRQAHMTLALKLFRGERAITEFDWPFTPIHNSSKQFSTYNGSVLHLVLPKLQPGHG